MRALSKILALVALLFATPALAQLREWIPDYLPNGIVAEEYDAADSANITSSGGAVSSWCSRTVGNQGGAVRPGPVYHRCATQGTTASMPTVSGGVVSFSTSQYLNFPADTLAYTMDRYVLFVGKLVSESSNNDILLRVGGNTDRQPLLQIDTTVTPNKVYCAWNNTANFAQATLTTSATADHVVLCAKTNGILYLSVDGGTEATNASAIYPSASSATGNIGFGLNFTTKLLRIGADELSADDRLKMIAWASRKYGVTLASGSAAAAYVTTPPLIDSASLPEAIRLFPTQRDVFNGGTGGHGCEVHPYFGRGSSDWDCASTTQTNKDAFEATQLASNLDMSSLIPSFFEDFSSASSIQSEGAYKDPAAGVATGTSGVYSPAIDAYAKPYSTPAYFVKSACAGGQLDADGVTTFAQFNMTRNGTNGGNAAWNVCSLQTVNKSGKGFAQTGGGLYQWRVRLYPTPTADGTNAATNLELWPGLWTKGLNFYLKKAEPNFEGDVLEAYSNDPADAHSTWFWHQGDAVQGVRGDVQDDPDRSFFSKYPQRAPWNGTFSGGTLFDGQWHIWSLQLDASLGLAITYIDGYETGRFKAFPEMFNQGLYMIATETFSQNANVNAQGPNRMDLDWIKAFRIPASEAAYSKMKH